MVPTRALDGQQLFFVAYDYDSNYIFAIPLISTTDDDIIKAFKQVYNILKAKGLTPTFNVTDNQAATPSKLSCKKTWEPHNLSNQPIIK